MHRAALGADAGGELEHVVLGGGGQDRAGVVQDDPGQPAGLAAAGRAEDHRVLVQGQAQGVPVVGAAGQDRVVRGGGEQPLGEGEGGAGPAGVAEHGQPSPPPPQFDDGGEAFAGVQAQAEADAQQADPVAGQPAAVEERPLDRDQDQPGGGDEDGDFFHGRGSVAGVACWCRAWTWARRTRRAVPGCRSTSAAISPAIRAVRLSGSRGRSWRWLARAISRSCLPGLPSARRRAVGAPGLVGGEGAERGWWRRGGCGAAGGDGAFLDDPAAEPGQRAGGGQGQAQQPQQHGAGDGERGGVVAGEVLAGGCMRASAQARTTPMRVSLARA